jgi:XisI protein.
MERVDEYRQVIHRLLAEYRDWYAQPEDGGVDTEIIADDAHGQYLLMRVGWRARRGYAGPPSTCA